MSRPRAGALVAALLALAAALSGPLAGLADRSVFSAHVLQHLLLAMVFAPLFVLGLPAGAVRALIVRPGLAPAARVLGSPWVGGALYATVLAVGHLPPVYDALAADAGLRSLGLAAVVLSALLAWWPVGTTAPEAGRVGEPAAMIYLFLLGVPVQIVAAWITLAKVPLYAAAAASPWMGGLSPFEDQQLGGLILWVPGGVAIWVAISALWVAWSKKTAAPSLGRPERAEEPPLTLPGARGG